MTSDPTSLDRLHDIVLPPSTPWWPPAPGWLWVLAALALLLLVLSLRAFSRWQRNHYRREALAELDQLEARINAGEKEVSVPKVAELLKRTAITAYPRKQVARLVGAEWFAFLDRTAGTQFAEGLGAALEQATYRDQPDALDAQHLQQLFQQVRQWIKHHARWDESSTSTGNTAAHIDAGAVNQVVGQQ